ncbi:protein of unknown function [Paraburkholderia dioscoreae]|uniref:Uncharacterized protein n=1 Tax=Paraburkholderia dioscoreae TaxID=2604047 RepID=A0A5Q4ZGX7_9BURK|nr:protein of unknown function [Paraburkholderia dioscoreae]
MEALPLQPQIGLCRTFAVPGSTTQENPWQTTHPLYPTLSLPIPNRSPILSRRPRTRRCGARTFCSARPRLRIRSKAR